jgi:hypothetical protein
LVGVGCGAEEEDVATEDRVEEVGGLMLVQVPKAELHPVPQCWVVDPHQPY